MDMDRPVIDDNSLRERSSRPHVASSTTGPTCPESSERRIFADRDVGQRQGSQARAQFAAGDEPVRRPFEAVQQPRRCATEQVVADQHPAGREHPRGLAQGLFPVDDVGAT